MFEKLSFTRLAKQFKQRGQVSILFSLLMPIFILFLGVALDLGWYYINVSRLQNAADAAAVAGAQTLIKSENFSDYKNPTLISKYPGKVSNQYRENDIYELTTIENGKITAEEYAGKNLSGDKNSLINSWTKNEVEFQNPTLYEQDNNLYFVVQLKDTVKHFFLSGWFDDMDAPVTAVAMLSREPATGGGNTGTETGTTYPDIEKPADEPNVPTIFSFPDMPILSSNELFDKQLNDNLKTARNKNVIVGNWEVHSKYKGATGSMLETYQQRFEAKVYDKAWNHLQDLSNHYDIGDLYRKQTVSIFDDVFDDNSDGKADRWGKENYGNKSDVVATSASSNPDKHNGKGKPYLGERVDSLNIDFKPEVQLSGKWLEQDWDITEGYFPVDDDYKNKSWASTVSYDEIKKLRIHSSLNFDGAYKVRTNEEFLERDDDGELVRDENGKLVTDVLWVRIESEPMLYHPDSLDGGKTGYVTISTLNSVNQIIININASNYDTATDSYRPVIIFYDGPETYDIYKDKNEKGHVRDSKPVILNLNKPFRGVLYAPNSPVVIIGECKDNFRGFVVAKEYYRLKNEDDDYFESRGYTNRDDLSIYGARTYEDNEGNTCYKITDENGIEMFVDERGDILFDKLDEGSAPKRYGTYDNFGRTDFSTENYKVLKESANNLLVSGE